MCSKDSYMQRLKLRLYLNLKKKQGKKKLEKEELLRKKKQTKKKRKNKRKRTWPKNKYYLLKWQVRC